jgi:hypothetical protein
VVRAAPAAPVITFGAVVPMVLGGLDPDLVVPPAMVATRVADDAPSTEDCERHDKHERHEDVTKHGLSKISRVASG